MATYESIHEALENVRDAVAFATSLVESYDELQYAARGGANGNSNHWVFTVKQTTENVAKATEQLEMLLLQHALPILKDMAQVNTKAVR
ncbi:hypothetical protein THIX_60002 [Thiomonas sp. X19]|uniref:hypothetical protein n=1 Tax=Thiomonas sp. X19 TaxID=1050370 RepID=UPI000B65922C|nr:hypothetical protein [Thiomonas sp. X19]SCC93944.1 hypothetical protein THIX_60002 [Thiomonas sp. X19]